MTVSIRITRKVVVGPQGSVESWKLSFHGENGFYMFINRSHLLRESKKIHAKSMDSCGSGSSRLHYERISCRV
ncbi:Uncharacterized protein HZ326_27714 [Fusarium oxysporum f. sp. albedinis]|nr:Uncharacterized protein HZ326_27714 [Fusarium oxysporum f. sp. albedinis]